MTISHEFAWRCLTCGLRCTEVSGSGWRHSSGGGIGRTPSHMRHDPVPMTEAEYDRMGAIDCPPDEARAIAARAKAFAEIITDRKAGRP